MIETKMHSADIEPLRSPKGQKKAREAPGLKRSSVRRRQRTRSVVDDTFAALPIRKHTRIQQLIAQTKYGE